MAALAQARGILERIGDVSGLILHALVRLPHSEERLTVSQGDAHPFAEPVLVFAREGEDVAGEVTSLADVRLWSGAGQGRNPMDQRIESFLTDVLALAGEDPDVIRDAVRAALGDLLDGFVLIVLIAVAIGTIYYAIRLVTELRHLIRR